MRLTDTKAARTSGLAAVLFVVSLLVSACFPYHYTRRPGVTGVVLDAESATPLPNASIVVQSRNLDESTRQIQGTSGFDGTFHLAPQQFWGIYIIPMDVFGPQSIATIAAPGYATVTTRLASSAMGPSRVALGAIMLRRQSD
jgi:hypothetical protein